MSSASLQLGGDNWAAKDGNLLGYQRSSSSSVHIPHEFTFTRGSNLAATRVAANGLIEKGRENLLLQSNSFDTTWLTSEASVTSGQSGYNGSSDAWKLEADSDGNGRRINQSITQSGVFVFSVYVKAGTTDFIRLNLNGAGNCFFNISESSPSVLTSSNVNLVGSIQAIGDGWNRCSLLNLTGSSITEVRINLASGDNDLSAVTGDNIYIQDAQLEIGLTSTEYIETGATTVQAGLLEDEPRIDYTGGTGSLLLEPSRTNLSLYSEALLSYDTFKVFGSEVTKSYTTNTTPEGLNSSVTTILEEEATSNHRCYFNDIENCTIGSTYSFSIFAKSVKGRNIRIADGGKGFEVDTIVDLSDGSILTNANNNVSVEDFGNGWYRISAFGTNNSIYSTQRLFINSVDGTTLSFAGDTTKGFLLWGAQFEEGSYPTSYIPNHSGGSVTRAADAPSNTSAASIIGQTEGTIFIDFLYESNQSGNRFSISDGTASNWIFIATPESGTSSRFYIRVNSSVIIDVGASSYFVDGQRYKLALAYKSGDWAVYGNGTQLYVGTDNIPSFSSPMDTINFKSFNPSDAVTEKEKINQVLLFDTRISNGNLATLTS